MASGSSIIWDAAQSRFRTTDGLAYLQYTLRSVNKDQQVMDLVHTYVPPSKRGGGIAGLLCVAAFEHAKQQGLSVIPTCSYVSDTFLHRNPKWKDVVFAAEEASADEG